MTFADVEGALAALEARGARAFDRDGCDLVRTLLARGAGLPPPAAALLLPRARAHLERLRERFERARESTGEQLDGAEQFHGPLPEQRAALERGEFRPLRRELRRLDRRPASLLAPERQQRCVGEYEAALSELSAQFTVARAVDEVPVDAGPYNPLRIATDLLARIGAVSPTYLTAQLTRLEELAVMLTLPELPSASRPTQQPTKRPRPRARPKRRSSRPVSR